MEWNVEYTPGVFVKIAIIRALTSPFEFFRLCIIFGYFTWIGFLFWGVPGLILGSPAAVTITALFLTGFPLLRYRTFRRFNDGETRMLITVGDGHIYLKTKNQTISLACSKIRKCKRVFSALVCYLPRTSPLILFNAPPEAKAAILNSETPRP